MNPLWLIRMARLVRHRPSPRVAAIWVGVIVMSLLVAGAEGLWGWPEWLTVNPRPRLPKP